MSKKEIIPVFYSCDDAFAKFTLVSLYSLKENASENYSYRIHILNTGIHEDMKEKFRALQEEHFEICFEDVSLHLTSIREKLPIRDYYSKTTYYRLFIAEMFPEYDKAVYLDSDTIVTGDISELFFKEIGDCYVGACQEQVMLQEDVYGTYVEQVVGIDRNRFFNAGVLLINCRAFRENCILDRFVELLQQYDFVVTQDEDYLNVLCKDHVFWLKQQWNMEVFGRMVCEPDGPKIIHYIMVSKPWHYEDCQLGGLFWSYAEKTPVYEAIRALLEGYTEEERRRDAASGERLLQTAIAETRKENNYVTMLKNGTLKSRDRILILDKIARYEREGRFDEDVEDDPPSRELLPEEVDYLREKLMSRIKTRLTFGVARFFVNRLISKGELIIKEIRGIEHYRNLQSGAVITCNHFNAFDSFAMQLAYDASGQTKRKFYRVIREGNYTNFPGFYGMLMRNCNTFPLSSNLRTMEKFLRSMDAALQNGDFMLVYPEQSMWWNYRKPKPLKKGAYSFAVRNNVPVLPCFITMQDSDTLGSDGFYIQEYTIHISAPIYPETGKTKAENIEAMRQKNYEVWKRIYEETYGEELVYEMEKSASPEERQIG